MIGRFPITVSCLVAISCSNFLNVPCNLTCESLDTVKKETKGDLTCKYKFFLRYCCESPVPLNWFALFDVECVICIIVKKKKDNNCHYVLYKLILNWLCALLSKVPLLRNACGCLVSWVWYKKCKISLFNHLEPLYLPTPTSPVITVYVCTRNVNVCIA